MDESKEYIDMCKKLPDEFKDAWKPNVGDYHTWNDSIDIINCSSFKNITGVELRDNRIWGGEEYKEHIIGRYGQWVLMSWNSTINSLSTECIITQFQNTFKTYNDCTWLPRQDQLQTMIYERGYNNYFYYHNRFTKFLDENFRDFLTYEQLWLAFIMYEKYGKKWSGEEWI